MHTIIVLAVGFALLGVCLLAGKLIGGNSAALAKAALVFLPLWLVGAGIHTWVGLTKAGYIVRGELPIVGVMFAIPAAVALVLWWKFNAVKTNVVVAHVGAPAIEHDWEDGPQFTGWDAVTGKYPDGTPAEVEGTCGKGWVILCGVHPEAPENWRRGMTFTTSANIANAHAAKLIEAALNRIELPHY